MPPACADNSGGAEQLDSLCLILELISRLRELSDEPREVTGLVRDVNDDGLLNDDASAGFADALRELIGVGTAFLEEQ